VGGLEQTGLPVLAGATRGQAFFWGLSIATAVLTWAALAYQIATAVDLWQWWLPLAFVAGMAAADLGSGLVHWGADTWGREDFPVIGPRLLVPFRVHHVNPADILQRSFLDTNGDVAAVTLPVLACLFAVPLDSVWGRAAAVFGFAFCGIGMLTNQITSGHTCRRHQRSSAFFRTVVSS
jgi:hypothetical protein